MKKITLFALAALVASGAYAAGPTVQAAYGLQQTEAKLAQPMKTKVAKIGRAVFADTAVEDKSSIVSSRANEDSYYPLYYTEGAMYLGLSQTLSGYGKPFGFTPARGEVYFVPTDSAKFITSTLWSWRSMEMTNEGIEYGETATAADDVLALPLGYESMYESPTLVATVNGQSYEYSDSAVAYFGGRNPYYWGYYSGDNEESPEPSGMWGVSPCPYVGNNWFGNPMSAIIRTDASAAWPVNENGVAKQWGQLLSDESGNPQFSDLQITGLTYRMPAQPVPYQLSGCYIWLQTTSSKAVSLTATVYGFNEQGRVDRNIVYGKGVATLPAGNFNGSLRFDLKSVDDLGLTINSPICTSKPLWIEINGFNVPEITFFAPVYNMNLTVPCENDDDMRFDNYVYDYAYPTHSVINMTGKDVTTGEVTILNLFNPSLWYPDDKDDTTLAFAREFAMYFIIDNPVVINAETGKDSFSIDLPTEGGVDYVAVTASEDLPQLVSDEYLTYSVYTEDDNSDWLTVELGTFQDAPGMLGVQAIAEALPAGVTGRYAIINFTGYACDFQVLVTQGEAGIASVVYNGTRAAGYYDLQGRKLNAAPAKGFYIESNGTNANVKMAR